MKRSARAFLPLALLLLALGLRAYRLDAQSLWYDEGNSARIAERSVRLIIEGAAGDIHPPLYYLLLAGWRAFAGESEYALRFFSLIASVITCAGVFALGRAIRRDAANTSLWLIALHPLAVYYAQEARMYALLALFATASTLLLLFLPQSKAPWRWLAAFALVTAAGLYTQYAYPFVMVAQGVWVLAWCLMQRQLRTLFLFSIGCAFGLMLFAPWAPTAIRQVTTWPATVISPREDAIQISLAWMFAGRTAGESAGHIAIIFGSVLAAIGLTSQARNTRIWLLTLVAFVPLAIMAVLGLFRDAYLKVLLMSVGPLITLIAVGVKTIAKRLARIFATKRDNASIRKSVRIARSVAALLAVALALPSTFAIRNHYSNPAYAKEDYRGLARLIDANWRTGDAVLFLAANQWEVFTYYRRNDTGLFPLPYRPTNLPAAQVAVTKATSGAMRVYGLYYAEQDADPAFFMRQSLDEALVTAHSEWRGNVRFAVHVPRNIPVSAGWPYSSPINIGNLVLNGGAAPSSALQPGDVWSTSINLSGTAQRPLKAFVHVGRAAEPPRAQSDVEVKIERIASGSLTLAVWLPPGMPAGAHDVFIGLYDAETGERLPVTGAPSDDNRLRLATITVR